MSRAQLTSTVEQNTGGAVAPFVAGKNKIINGDFGVWQRGTTFASIAAGSYCADRFQETHDGTGTATVTQQAFTPGTAPVAGYEGTYFLRDTLNTVGTSTFLGITHLIEDVRTFAGQTVTLSFWAKADSARTSIVFLAQQFGTGGSTTVYTNTPSITYGTTWARYSFTFAIPSISGKTIGTGSNLLVSIRSTATTGSVLDTWGWQLEAGSVATSFTTASGTLQGELSLCQRYYYQRNSNGAFGMIVNGGIASSTTGGSIGMNLPVTMRTKPASAGLVYSNIVLSDSVTTTNLTGFGIDSTTTLDCIMLDFGVAAGLIQYRPYNITSNGTTAGYIGISAEL
jgi:hypothetical protein